MVGASGWPPRPGSRHERTFDDTGVGRRCLHRVLSMGKVWDGAVVRKWAAGYTPRTRPKHS